MKAKSIFQCAALLTGLLFLNVPLFAAVESDIVGYTTIPMEAGKWYMMTAPFVGLSEGATINDLLCGGFCDNDLLYLYDNTTGTYKAIRAWKDGMWRMGTANTTPATDVLPPGQGFFIVKAAPSTVTIAGQVSDHEVSTFGSESGPVWSMTGVCYPEGVQLNSLSWSGLANGDLLYLYDNETNSYKAIRAWKDGAWRVGTANSTLATDLIKPGQGFFINKVSTGTGSYSK